MTSLKPRLLSGDTPTGRLHLGHWVGSLEARLSLQDAYECYFIIANVHAFTTRYASPKEIRQATLDIALDYLSIGIDPKKVNLFIQSEIPAIAELTWFFSMLLPYSRVMRNPTLKDEIHSKQLGEHYPFGFLLYPVGQIADILSLRAEIVPVGQDQIPHLEMTRECARRFNQLYCGVDPQTKDEDYVKKGGLFPIIQAKLTATPRLVGIGKPDDKGVLPKMSKSLNNAIYLSDDPDTIKKKVMSMYTDPNRQYATDPGTIENNPLWIFHDVFNPDKAWVTDAKDKYRKGRIKDIDCKKELSDRLITLTQPMRERRKHYENDPKELFSLLQRGTERANAIAEDTLAKAKVFMKQNYFKRQLFFLR